ncbi:cytochrome oxidase maturation protein, cbb3-type [Cyclobacterium xiamenense]|uniref:Cytochrome oxidase maturation protein, cbb3-type n=1 Tax=Cyclobacterium xiamenense TaxID=1297121 RepID=A0A1H7ATI9_9BACT|nr:cbb3-type cytochrome oxidase assembly protein CcoS [Cyclobacterium xiamenense]SEJ64365.1 cytochrome oxidase maturation protein, cbb3-type [Cyclobacterium xiamenense]
MEVIFVLIGVSLAMAGGFLWLFFKAMKGGQFDDQHTPAMRILFERKTHKKHTTNKKTPKNTK